MKRIVLMFTLIFSAIKTLACPNLSGIYECSSVNDNGEHRIYQQSVYQGLTSAKTPFYSFVNAGDTYLTPLLSGSFIADGVTRTPFKQTYTMTCSSAAINLRVHGAASTQTTFNSNINLFLDGNNFIKKGEAVILKEDGTSQTVELEEVCSHR